MLYLVRWKKFYDQTLTWKDNTELEFVGKLWVFVKNSSLFGLEIQVLDLWVAWADFYMSTVSNWKLRYAERMICHKQIFTWAQSVIENWGTLRVICHKQILTWAQSVIENWGTLREWSVINRFLHLKCSFWIAGYFRSFKRYPCCKVRYCFNIFKPCYTYFWYS